MKTIMQTLLSLSLSLTLFSCGASKSDDLASRADAGEVASSDKPLAYCNIGSSSNYSLNQKAYGDTNGNWNPQYTVVKFTAVPISFTSGANYIQFFRWMASSNNTTSLDATALSFVVYDLATGKALTTSRTTMSWANLQSAASSLGIFDSSAFFKRIVLLVDLRDTEGSYDALRTVAYKTADNKMSEQFDSLIPIFDANPGNYATESSGSARAQVLRELHPFKGTALSTADYTARANAFCDPFKVVQ